MRSRRSKFWSKKHIKIFGRLEPWSILDVVQFRRAQLHTGSIFGSDWFLVICLFKGGRLLIEFSTSKEASLSSSSQPLPAPITSLLGWLPLFVSPTQTLGSSGFSGEWGAPSPIIPSKPALITENDKTVWKLRELSGNGNRYAKEFLALFCGGFMLFFENEWNIMCGRVCMKTVLFDNSKIHLEIEFERGDKYEESFRKHFSVPL